MPQARIRDIEDGFGNCLRVGVAAHPTGAVITLERLDQSDHPAVMLSQFGGELLTAFILVARLSVPHPAPDEIVHGPFPATFRLVFGRTPIIVIDQDDSQDSVEIGVPLWDRLYAELGLVNAHARDIARRSEGAYN